MKNTTPLPWHVEQSESHRDKRPLLIGFGDDKEPTLVADFWPDSHLAVGCPEVEEAQANAEFAMRACNLNGELLVAALRLIGTQSVGPDWTHEQAFNFMRETARVALSKARFG